MRDEHSFPWNDETDGELRRLFDLGFSGSQIAADLAGRFGHYLTRCAVLGRLGRLGLKRGRPNPVPRPPRVQRHGAKAWKPRAPTPASEPEPVAIAPEVMPVPQPCALMDLTDETCRWPIGEGTDMLFCGERTADLHNGRPYCQMHERMAYAPRAATRRPFIPMRKSA